MPWESLEEARAAGMWTSLEGVALTLAQVNELETIAEAVRDKVKNPWAVAIAQWKRGHVVEGGRWVRAREEEKKLKQPYYLVRLATSLPAGEGTLEPPAEIQLSPAGWVETETQGRYLMDETAMDAILAAFRRSAREIVIDYEHQTLYGGEAPAAGWTRGLLQRGEQGLWAAASWTERAGGYLRSREYRYLSPVFLVRASDRRPVQLHSVALTNSPEIRGLLPLVAGQRYNLFHPTEEEDPMREWLIQILKLAAEVTDEEIQAAMKEQLKPLMTIDDQGHLVRSAATLIAHKQILEVLGLPETTSLSEAVATILALKQQGNANVVSMEEFKQLQKEVAQRKRDEQVAKAIQEGKVIPAQKEWAEEYALRDPEGFAVFALKAPVVVPLGSKMTGGNPPAGEIEEAQASINKQLRVSAETFKKYYPNQA